MADTVVLDFVGDPSGLKPVYDALTALGQLTDQQQKDFAKANEDFKKRMQESGKATQQTATQVEKLSTGAKELSKTFAGAEIKNSTKDLNTFSKGLVEAGKQSTSLKARLREIKTELSTMDDEGSPAFQKLSLEAAKLQDKIGDVSERIRVLASDTFAIDAVVDGVRGLTAAFTIAQSASALFGKENEDLQKALLKVQAATGLLIGVQEIANQLTGQGAAKLAILSGAQKLYAFAVGTATGAMKAFRIALLGTGIGVFIFLLYEAANAMGLFTSEVKDNTAELEKQKSAQEEATRAAEDAAKARQDNIDNLRKETDRLTKSREELAKQEIEIAQQTINELNNTLKYYDAAKEKVDRISRELYENQNNLFDQESGLNKQREELIIELSRIKYDEARRVDAELLVEQRKNLQAQIDANKKIIKEIEDERLKKAKETNQKLADEFKKTFAVDKEDDLEIDQLLISQLNRQVAEEKEAADRKKEILQDLKDFGDRLQDESYESTIERIEKEKAAEARAAEEIRQIKQAAIQAIGMVIDEAFNRQQEQIQATLTAELNALNEQQQAILSNESLTGAQKEAIQKQFAQKEAEAKRKAWIAERDAKAEQALINGLLSFTTSLATQGYPAGLITGALALALAGVQAALIASKQPPAFAKGTDYAPGGAAWVGEKGTELVREPSGKTWLTPNEATLLDIKRGSQIIPNFRLNEYADMIPSIPDTTLRQFEANRSSTLDYGRLGREFAKELGKNPMLSVSIDRNGVNLLIKKANRTTNYLNNKFRN